jgi:cytochrome c551/c552
MEGELCCLPSSKPESYRPSLQDIAKIYKDKNADMVSFLKGEGEPIVDPSQYK